MATAEPKKEGSTTCEEGFYPVWKWCFKETTLQKLKEPIKDVFEWPDIPWPPTGAGALCKMLYTTFMAAFKALKNALAIPSKYIDMAKQLVKYPFDAANDIVNSALGFLDKLDTLVNSLIKDAIGSLTGSAGGMLNDLKSLCESVLSCPYAADSELGKLAASILDGLKAGTDITGPLKELRNALAGAAKDAINSVKEVPLQALNNIEQAYYNLLKQLGVEDMIKHANNIAACIRSMCTIMDLGEKLYAKFQAVSADGLVSTVKKTLETTTDKASSGFIDALTETGSEVAGKIKTAQTNLTNLFGYPNW